LGDAQLLIKAHLFYECFNSLVGFARRHLFAVR
jgi:hypothetical protein